jgi:dihydrofolate synthase/folylpolyglutamate synthase
MTTTAAAGSAYERAVRFLSDLRLFGAKFGLENTLKLAALCGNPQDALRFVHVAGTNGKGSTCAMLESIYRTAGLRVGLFTSPHLVSFTERIQVDRRPIGEDQVVRGVERIRAHLPQFPPEHHPTFFEVVTVLALEYFRACGCELVIWETGMGGRLDATNIVTPLASVITNVQFDHQQWLGPTLAQIAAEKAGIVKPGVPVVTGADAPEALDVIRRTAEERGCSLTVVTPEDARRAPWDRMKLPLVGEHQRRNAALTLAAVRVLQSRIPVSDAAIARGLETVNWPGRLQIVRQTNRTLVLDGAHNPAGAECLRDALESLFPRERKTLILGVLQDKDWLQICKTLAPLFERVRLVRIDSERAADPNELVSAFRDGNRQAEVQACRSLPEALALSANDGLVVVTGSLYLVGEALEHLAGSEPNRERGLNEWHASAHTHTPAS